MLKLRSICLPALFKKHTEPQLNQHVLGEDLSQISWRIGRDSTCDLCLADETVTGIHAKIQRIEGQYYLSDLRSRNGTIVNERELGRDERHCLQPEDKIQLGQSILYVDEVTVQGQHRQVAWWTNQSIVVECIGIVDETPDTKTFQFRSEAWFSYLPGQFVQIEAQIENTPIVRPYTISSSPTRPEILELTVKRSDRASPVVSVSNWLHDTFKVGDSLKLIGGAQGTFTPAPDFPPKLLLVAAGVGITPMMSIVRYLYDVRSTIEVVLLYSIKTRADWIFRAEMEFIAERHPYFHPRITLTRPHENEGRFGLTGRIHPVMVETVAPDWSDRTVFVCGSDSFRTAVRQTFEVMEFPMDRYHEESFGEAVASQRSEKSDLLPASTEQPQTCDQARLVNFVRSQKTVFASAEQSVLQIANQFGVAIPSSCLAGRCGICKVKVCQGQIEYRAQQPDTGLTQAERAQQYALACIASPVGAIAIEA